MIYEQLIDRRGGFIGPRHWLGNLRWIAEEMDAAGYLVFRTAPINSSECDLWKVALLEAGAFQDIAIAEVLPADFPSYVWPNSRRSALTSAATLPSCFASE